MQLFGGKKKGGHSASSSKKDSRPVREDEIIRSDKNTRYGRAPELDDEEFLYSQEKKGMAKWLKTTLIVVGVLLAVIAAAFIIFKLWIKPPDIAGTTPEPQSTEAPQETADVVVTAKPVETQAPEVMAAENRRPGTYTFAIIGKDVEGAHTDTVIVGMFDTVEGKLNFASIPRDTLVNTGYDVKKINYIYPACINNNKDGTKPLLNAVKDLLGYEVDCYAIVDVSAVEDLIDAVGGVWFDLPRDMHYDGWDQKPPIYIDLKKGYQLLNGADFVKVARFRYTTDQWGNIVSGLSYGGGDIDRIALQHDLLMAAMQQMLKVGNIPNLSKAIDIYEAKVETNLTARNLGYFASEFLKLDFSDISFQTLPGDASIWLYNVSYVSPYIDQWITLINEYLNPYNVDITTANVNMLSYDGENFTTTQGYIAGGEFSFKGSQAK